jgi:hypothetical protein
MRANALVVAGIASVLVSGCDRIAAASTEPTALEAEQMRALKRPTGRFQLAGTRQYPNGTEVYVLDTQSGQVCYYFVASGTGHDTAQKTDMQSCAGPALDPLLP